MCAHVQCGVSCFDFVEQPRSQYIDRTASLQSTLSDMADHKKPSDTKSTNTGTGSNSNVSLESSSSFILDPNRNIPTSSSSTTNQAAGDTKSDRNRPNDGSGPSKFYFLTPY